MPLPNPPDGTGTTAQRLAALEGYVTALGQRQLRQMRRERRTNAQAHDPACSSLKIALADRAASQRGEAVPGIGPCDCWLSQTPETE